MEQFWSNALPAVTNDSSQSQKQLYFTESIPLTTEIWLLLDNNLLSTAVNTTDTTITSTTNSPCNHYPLLFFIHFAPFTVCFWLCQWMDKQKIKFKKKRNLQSKHKCIIWYKNPKCIQPFTVDVSTMILNNVNARSISSVPDPDAEVPAA